jgi:hypothetical protein
MHTSLIGHSCCQPGRLQCHSRSCCVDLQRPKLCKAPSLTRDLDGLTHSPDARRPPLPAFTPAALLTCRTQAHNAHISSCAGQSHLPSCYPAVQALFPA